MAFAVTVTVVCKEPGFKDGVHGDVAVGLEQDVLLHKFAEARHLDGDRVGARVFVIKYIKTGAEKFWRTVLTLVATLINVTVAFVMIPLLWSVTIP